jgi:hypothetical protein
VLELAPGEVAPLGLDCWAIAAVAASRHAVPKMTVRIIDVPFFTSSRATLSEPISVSVRSLQLGKQFPIAALRLRRKRIDRHRTRATRSHNLGPMTVGRSLTGFLVHRDATGLRLLFRTLSATLSRR